MSVQWDRTYGGLDRGDEGDGELRVDGVGTGKERPEDGGGAEVRE